MVYYDILKGPYFLNVNTKYWMLHFSYHCILWETDNCKMPRVFAIKVNLDINQCYKSINVYYNFTVFPVIITEPIELYPGDTVRLMHL